MVNTEILKKQASQYKLTKETAVDYYKILFSKHEDLANEYGIDADSVGHSQKFIMMAMSELQYFFQLPGNFGQERQWRSALANFKEHYGDSDISLKYFNKTFDAFFESLQKHAGGLNTEQKTNWEELLKQAYADMKQWGWY